MVARRSLLARARWLVKALAVTSTAMLIVGSSAANARSLQQERPADGVSAILLDSYYGGCGVPGAWADLNYDWASYGSIPVSITTGGKFCSGKFTLADLEASGADTVIFDSTAFAWTLTTDELQAIQTYAAEGHTILGEDTVFQWKTKHSDNGLAPIFGLAEQPTWYIDGLQGMSPTYRLRERSPDAAVLLRDVSNPYVSSLYGRGQKPATKKWVRSDLDGARYIGRTQDRHNAITVYDAPGYTAIYISSEAAYESTPDDLQFLYNAIVYPNNGAPSPSSGG